MCHEVVSVVEAGRRGSPDRDAFEWSVSLDSILVTRDHDFANPLKYDPSRAAAIVLLVRGNLKAAEEADIVQRFVETHDAASFHGKLVLLSRGAARIRGALRRPDEGH